MDLKQLAHIHILGIKKWSNIIQIECKLEQYILEHKSSNGSQLALLNYNEFESIDKQKPIPLNTIHDKYGKHLKMCEINKNGSILHFVLENGQIIKYSIDDDVIHVIPSVPMHENNPYECLKVSECGESLLVSLKDTKHSNITNVWIYDQYIQKWFNTEYITDIEDPFKSYQYYNDSWYIMCIASDTAMSFEINISIHALSVITNDEISEISNEDVLVSTDCNISIDVSQFKAYLTNRIHKILWDLPNKLIVLLFDEFIIWISIQNDITMKPLYVVSLLSCNQNIQNMKFRDIVFILHGMIIAVVTNHGSILFYQRLSQHPILFDYHQMNTKQNTLKIDWKHQQNNTFKLHSIYDSNSFLVNNGRAVVQYQLEHLKLRYLTSNPLAFIRSNRCIEQYINTHKYEDIAHNELVLIRGILSFEIQKMLQSDIDNKSFMNSMKWFIDNENKHKIWEWAFIDILKYSKSLLKQRNMLKIITIYNKYFNSISKCVEIVINNVYEQMIAIINSDNIADILRFNIKDLFCNEHKLYDIMILILFEERSQIVINHEIGNLIDILWRISRINMIRHHKSPIILSFDSINIERDHNSTRSLFQKLRKWLDLQLITTTIEEKMIHIINNDTENNIMTATMSKEEFATLFWKKCSENQQYLISNSTKINCNIIHTLVDILTSNIIDFEISSTIKKVPLLSIYCDGKKKEFYDSEIQMETTDDDAEEKTDTLTPKEQVSVATSKSSSPLSEPENLNIAIQTGPEMTSTTQQTSNAPVPNMITSIVTAYNHMTEDVLTSSIEPTQNNTVDIDVNNAELSEEYIDIDKENDVKDKCIENIDDISETHNDVNDHKVKLQDIAPYVSQKYIIDHLANKLTKQELIELFARKVEITQKQHTEATLDTQKTAKWKLVQCDENNQIIPQQQISSRLIKKIKKYLRKKNKLMRMEQKRMRSDVNKEKTETNDHEIKCNKIENKEQNIAQKQKIKELKEINEEKKEFEIASKNNLTTAITNNISFISHQDIVKKNKYELSMDTFDCVHIAPSKTTETQTTPGDFIFDTKYIPLGNDHRKKISNWFVAPLLSAPKYKKVTEHIQPKTVETTQLNDHQDESQPIKNEQKESEMQTMAKDSEFVPIPIIGARTAGLSYIDPSVKINENSLMLQFPATHIFDELDEIKENQETQRGAQSQPNSLSQSQCSMMMHTVNSSLNMNNDVLKQSALNLNDVQHDIALMDAQIANLSSLCNNIQNSYYNINKRLDGNQEVNNSLVEMKRSENGQQIGTMQAWSLLQSIQENLDSIDDEMTAMNSLESNDKIIVNRRKTKRTHQLRKLKAKTKRKGKRRKELAKNLDQQTTFLNEIFNNLS